MFPGMLCILTSSSDEHASLQVHLCRTRKLRSTAFFAAPPLSGLFHLLIFNRRWPSKVTIIGSNKHNYEGNLLAQSKTQYPIDITIIEFRISNGTIYLAQGRSEAKIQDQRSLWDFRSLRAVFCSIALSSANPFGTLLERARSV